MRDVYYKKKICERYTVSKWHCHGCINLASSNVLQDFIDKKDEEISGFKIE